MLGAQSTLAPTSSITAGEPASVGNADASAGRSTPGSMPCVIFAVAITAPVLPAETTPCNTFPHETRSHTNGAVLLRANGFPGAVGHRDLFARVLDLD